MSSNAALVSTFTWDVESRMRSIARRDYDALNRTTWWRRVCKETPLQSKRERLIWLLDTAQIEYVNKLGGEVMFEDILSSFTEIDYKAATAGLKLNRYQMTDLENGVPGGEGMRLAAHWTRGVTAHAAYWPQQQTAKMINDGEAATSLAYDSEKFFDTDHPLNPWDSSAGTYANVFTGAASGAYPGALDISGAVTLDVAVENVGKALAYIAQIKQPNGVLPRNLRARTIMGPPALTTRIQQITNAKFIAQAAVSGGGGADIEAVVRNWGFDQPIEAVELGAGFTNGSDTSWYLVCEEATSDDLGALVYANREPFAIQFHDGMSDVELDRANELEWILRGANKAHYGHPFLIFKCKAA